MMKKQKLVNESQQTKEMKMRISENYIQKIGPYELMIQAINIQNKQIYELQDKYIKLLNQTKQLKNPQQYSEQELRILKSIEEQRIIQRKIFVEQGLRWNQKRYKQEYNREKKREQQILENKIEMLKHMKGHEINLFFNRQQNILDELKQYVLKQNCMMKQEGQKNMQDDRHINQEKKKQYIEQIKWWKHRLQLINKSQE